MAYCFISIEVFFFLHKNLNFGFHADDEKRSFLMLHEILNRCALLMIENVANKSTFVLENIFTYSLLLCILWLRVSHSLFEIFKVEGAVGLKLKKNQ